MVGKMPDIAVLMCQPYGGILHTLHHVFTNGPRRLSRPVFGLRSVAFEFSRRMPYVLICLAAIFKIPLIGGHHAGRD
jgi:hypothetical protein